MIGEYNIDFLITSLVLLLLVLFDFGKQKKLNNASTRVFRLFLYTGIADVLLDLLSTVLMVWDIGSLSELTRGILTGFYLMQILIPYFAIYYTQTLRQTQLSNIHRAVKFWAIVPVLMGLLVVTNIWSEILFGFDSKGNYYEGPLYMLTYVYGMLYAVGLLVICVVHHSELSKRNIRIVIEFLLIEAVSVAVQAYNGQYLTTGFGIGLCLTVLYLTVNNPYLYIDHLTDAFNMQYWRIWLREQLDRGRNVHVITADCSRLGWINKVFGRNAGNKILSEIAEEMQSFDPSARLFRLTGKRFLLAVESLAQYEYCRCSMQELFKKDFEVNGERVRFPAVICGIVNSESLKEMDVLLAYLEYMTGLASSTEDTVLIQSDDKIMEGFLYEQEIERFLSVAIEQDLFELNFQPVYSLKKKGYVSMEALSRLRHPTLGYVPPDVFIAKAEKSGQISQIEQLQFRRLCRFIKENPEVMEELNHVKFNLSPIELMRYDCGRELADTIREYGLSTSCVQFEITETAATEYSENLGQIVRDFQEAGIGLCLDDFGSGYANINTVVKLPFLAIKLDRSLLRDVGSEPQAAVFYQSIVGVLQNMGYQVIAEGAETEQEVEMLRSWNVDLIQGYYFSKPVSGEELAKLVLSKSVI